MKRLLVAALLTLGLGMSGFAKTIAVGETETITEDLVLDENLVVKGTLNVIGAKVSLTAGKYLYVGTENNATFANLNVTNGKIELPSSNYDGVVLVGKDGGYGRVTLDNSSLTACRMQMAFNTEWARAQLILTNSSTVVLGGGNLDLNARHNGRSAGTTIQSQVWIYEGCKLSAVRLAGRDHRSGGVYFGGGELSVREVTASENATLFLQGINGYPVKIEYVTVNSDLGSYLFNISSGTAKILLGPKSASDLTPIDCGFTKLGALDVPLVAATRKDQLVLAYTGETRVENGGLRLTTANQLPSGGDVHVGAPAKLWLGGFDQTWGSFTGGGVVTNDSETAAVVTLSVPENEVKTYSAGPVKGPAAVVKTGLGKLVVEKSSFANVTVREGVVEFADPTVTGYPEYEFIVDRPHGNTYSGLCYADVDLYAEDVRRTVPYERVVRAADLSCTDVKDVLDHNPDTSWWVNCTYDGSTSPRIGDRGYVDLSYASSMKLTSFSWTTCDNTGPSIGWCRDPGAWRLQGRYHGEEWVTLHSMTNKGYALEARKMETEKFPLAYPRTSVSLGGATVIGGSLVFPANVSAKVPAGQTFTATGSSVVLSSLAVDCSEENGTIVGGTVAATGKIYLTNVPEHGLRTGTRIPLTFSDTAVASNFDKWDIYVDGVLQAKRWATFADGQFTVGGFGMMLIVR